MARIAIYDPTMKFQIHQEARLHSQIPIFRIADDAKALSRLRFSRDPRARRVRTRSMFVTTSHEPTVIAPLHKH